MTDNDQIEFSSATSFPAEGAEGADETVDTTLFVEPGRHPAKSTGPTPEPNPAPGTQGTEGTRTLDREDHHRQTETGGAGDREPGPGRRTGDKGHHPGRTRDQGTGPGKERRDELRPGGTGRSGADHHPAAETNEAREPGNTGRRSSTQLTGQEDHRAGAGRPTTADQGTKGEQISAQGTTGAHETATGEKTTDNGIHAGSPRGGKGTRTDNSDIRHNRHLLSKKKNVLFKDNPEWKTKSTRRAVTKWRSRWREKNWGEPKKTSFDSLN